MRRLNFSDEIVAAAAEVTVDDGKPVEMELLDREIAGPSMGGVRSVIAGNASTGLDPVKLARILNAAVNGQPEEYYQLAEEMEEKYPHYRSVLNARKLAVTQLDITIEAATDDPREQKDAELCREYLDRCDLEHENYHILDAFGKGWSATEIIWPEGLDRLKMPWMPRLERRPQGDFEFDQYDGETLRLKGGPNNDSALPTDLPAYKFIIHRSSGKSGLTVRGGLARVVAWGYLFQNMSLKDWVLCAQTYGMPIRIGKYDKSATQADRMKLLRAVMNIASDSAAIIPDSMAVDFVEAMAGATPAMYKDLCEYVDQSVSKATLGQTATTDATAGGLGGSQGTVHDGVRERFQRADARALAATLLRDLFRPLIILNHGAPPSGLFPKVKIGQAEEFTEQDLLIAKGLVELGVKIETSVLRDRAGYPDPPVKGADGKPVELCTVQTAPAQVPAPENELPAPHDPANDAEAAKAIAAASNRILGHLKAALETGSSHSEASTSPNDDLIDLVVADLDDDWQPIMAPMIDPLQDAVTASSSFAELKENLLKAIAQMDVGAVTSSIAARRFAARLAGEAGAGLDNGGSHGGQ